MASNMLQRIIKGFKLALIPKFTARPWANRLSTPESESKSRGSQRQQHNALYQQVLDLSLLAAIEAECHYSVEHLMKMGANANARNPYDSSKKALMLAACKRNIMCVDTLTKAGAEVNIKDKNGHTPLMWIARRGCAETLKTLIKAGANVNTVNNERNRSGGRTALELAASFGHRDCVAALVEAGADVNNDRWSALTKAVEGGYHKCAEILVKAGADVNSYALMKAVERGHYKCAKLLIDAGADVNMQWSDHTPLTQAAEKGNTKFLKFLISSGADINLKNKGFYRSTALMTAIECDQNESLKTMIKAGVDLNVQNRLGNTALMVAAMKCQVNYVQLLVQAGAHVNISNEDGDTALMAAIRHGHDKCFEILTKQGANLNIQTNFWGNTALIEAVQYGHDKFVEILTKQGADVNKQNRDGTTALMEAVRCSNDRCVEILIESGTAVNKQNNKGETALLMSEHRSPTKYLKILTDAGADVNICAHNGRTLMDDVIYAYDDSVLANMKLVYAAGININMIAIKENRTMVICHKDAHELLKLMHAAGENIDEMEEALIDRYLRGDSEIELELFTTETIRERIKKELTKVQKFLLEKVSAAGGNVGEVGNKPQSIKAEMIRMWNISRYLGEDQNKVKISIIKQHSKWNPCHFCRVLIRERMLEKSNVNLLYRIQRLKLPKPLKRYLVYNVSLEDDK